MSGSHHAPEPSENRGPLTVDDLLATVRDVPGTQYDLTPPDALHPLTDIAALRLEVARLADALNYANGRIDEQGREIAVLQTAVARLADALTVLQLREGL